MPKRVQILRGTTSAISDLFAGREGELYVDLEKQELRVHNGITVGGFPVLRADLNNVRSTTSLQQTTFLTALGFSEYMRGLRTTASVEALKSALIGASNAAATDTVLGFARAATDVEVLNDDNVNAYVNPAQLASRLIPGLVVGTTITTSTTLTAVSANFYNVNMSSAAQSITLPDATTLTAVKQYLFVNTGGPVFGIRNSSGQLIGRVGAGITVSVYLRNDSTVAGEWVVEGQDAFLPLTILETVFSSTYSTPVPVIVRLTDTLSLHFIRNTSGHPFVFAVDHSTYPATVGTPVIIVASNVDVDHAFRVSNTKAFVLVAGGTNYNVTVSGTTCTVSSSSTAAVLDAATFTDRPLVCALSDTLYVGIDVSGGAVRAQAVDASGTNPSAGSSVNIVASGGQVVNAIYRVSATRALALYTDDSGTPGSPYSLRGVVLSVSGTTVTVNTTAGVNDIVSTTVPASVQLTDTSYVLMYADSSSANPSAVHVGVSGTTVTFGTPLLIETVTNVLHGYSSMTANRFQPNLFKITGTTALAAYGVGTSGASRHLVITNSAGTLSAGTTLFGAMAGQLGGNFPQTPNGFLLLRGSGDLSGGNRQGILNIDISGTSLTITGRAFPQPCTYRGENSTARFGLSGNYYGVTISLTVTSSTSNPNEGTYQLFRRRSGSAPQYVGNISIQAAVGSVPVELASDKVAFSSPSYNQSTASTGGVALTILEFPL